MNSLEKWYIFTPLQKLPMNVWDLCKLIVAKGFKKLPKEQKIAQSVTNPLPSRPLISYSISDDVNSSFLLSYYIFSSLQLFFISKNKRLSESNVRPHFYASTHLKARATFELTGIRTLSDDVSRVHCYIFEALLATRLPT